MRDPLIPIVLAIATGILASHYLSFSRNESLLALIPLTLFALIASSPWLKKTAGLLAVFFLGTLTESQHRPPPNPTIDATSKEIMILEGCVVDPTVFSQDREQFTLELAPNAKARISFNLDDETPPQRLDYGQRVEIEARIREPHNYNNPGNFDYALYLARQKIFWTATMARHTTPRILPGRCGSRFWSIIYKIRTAAVDRIEKLYPNDPYDTGMLEAVLIGEKSKLEKVWIENFRRTGTYHTLVIAGFHVTILAACLLFLLRVCNLNPTQALAITCLAAWLYALVSGSNAPAIRAASGFTLYAIARFFFRRGRVLNLLSAVALIYLLLDPDQLFDAAFQFSFLCVAAIGAFAAPILNATSVPLARALKNPSAVAADPHLPPRSAQFRVELRLIAEAIHPITLAPLALLLRVGIFAYEMAVISTVVQIGLALPMAEDFHRISFSGFSSNLIVTPLMGALVPIGFLAIFTGWHLPAALSLRDAQLFCKSRRTGMPRIDPNWRIPDPPLWLALSFLASLIAARRPHPPQVSPLARRSRVALPLHPVDLAAPFSPIRDWPAVSGADRHRRRPRRQPARHLPQRRKNADRWRRTPPVRPRRADPPSIPAKMSSPPISGPEASSTSISSSPPMPIRTTSEASPPSSKISAPKALGRRESSARASSRRRAAQYPGHPPPRRARLQLLRHHASKSSRHPPISLPPRPSITTPWPSASATANVPFCSLATWRGPWKLFSCVEGADIRADVLKVGHHGSKTSTIQPFLDAVAPSIALISDGFENSFGHPNKDVLARLNARHTAVLRTDLDGLITVKTDGRRLMMDTERWSNGSTSLGSVWNPNLVQ